MKSKQLYIYGLFDPGDDKLFYIGKTRNARQRFNEHMYRCNKKFNLKTYNRINEIMQSGLRPYYKIITGVNESNWQNIEIKLIKYYRKLGFDLTNVTSGGMGGNGGQNKRSVVNTDIYGNIISEYGSITEASAITGVPKGGIIACLKKRTQSSGGYGWQYKSNFKKQIVLIKKRKNVPIRMLDPVTGILLRTYPSCTMAAIDNNCSRDGISHSIKGNQNYMKYKWEYCR
jgi:hypothetical protein